jgi:hypothetical protein
MGDSMKISVTGSTFSEPGRAGDFTWMIERPEWRDTLFVFNDNEEQFRAWQQDPNGGAGCTRGGGNAAIRPWRCARPPRAAGIPTGRGGRGYPALTDDVRSAIDAAVDVIEGLLETGRYTRVLYSAGASDDDLGTGIFSVDEGVRRYIVQRLRGLARP